MTVAGEPFEVGREPRKHQDTGRLAFLRNSCREWPERNSRISETVGASVTDLTSAYLCQNGTLDIETINPTCIE